MHYLIQASLADLESAAVEVFDGVQWVRQWKKIAGDSYWGKFSDGQAFFSGPLTVGNPNNPWFEVQASDPAVIVQLAGVGNEMALMRSEMRSNALLRAAYRASGRGLIRNGSGKPIGVMPAHAICGTNLIGSYLAGEDIDEAEELLDLEP